LERIVDLLLRSVENCSPERQIKLELTAAAKNSWFAKDTIPRLAQGLCAHHSEDDQDPLGHCRSLQEKILPGDVVRRGIAMERKKRCALKRITKSKPATASVAH